MTDIAVMDSDAPGPLIESPGPLADCYGSADLLQRVKAEFMEMPGLTLTYDQAVKLWDCHPVVCREVLETLVQSRFLCAPAARRSRAANRVRSSGRPFRAVPGHGAIREADLLTPRRRGISRKDAKTRKQKCDLCDLCGSA